MSEAFGAPVAVAGLPDFSRTSGRDDDLKDFSKPRKRVAFQIDGDVFEAPPVIPAMVLMDYTKSVQDRKDDAGVAEQMASMTGLLEMVLRPASYTLFVQRLADRDRPIGLDQLQEVIEFLMGEYGMRPTKLPAESPDGQLNQASGMNSQETQPDVASISPDSPSTSS
jgi:hypothetical protein